MNIAYLIDFDGTVTTADTLQYLLDNYGMKNWRELDIQVENGEITEREAFTTQMNSLQINLEEAVSILLKKMQIRSGFHSFLEYCHKSKFPILIVSAGFKELIEPILLHNNIVLEIRSNHINSISDNGWKFATSVPFLSDCNHSVCKCHPFEEYKQNGYHVVFIGDGITDFCVAMKCSVVYAVQHSSLAKMLLKKKKPFFEFQSFEEIIQIEQTRIKKQQNS